MNLGIYKPGQGHWVRVMTAVLVGLVTAAFAYWVYKQMLIVADRLPKSGYRVGLQQENTGALTAGQRVELVTTSETTGNPVVIGTATVGEIDNTEKRRLTLTGFTPNPAPEKGVGTDPAAASAIRLPGPDSPLFRVPRNGVAGTPPIEPQLLAGGVAGIIVIGGAVLAYWFIGLRPRTVEFLIATDFEMKKVNWSTPREIIGHTWVVIGACFLLAAILFAVDIGLKSGFTAVRLLPSTNQPPAKANP